MTNRRLFLAGALLCPFSRWASAASNSSLLNMGDSFEESISLQDSKMKIAAGSLFTYIQPGIGGEHSFNMKQLERQIGMPACEIMITHDLEANADGFISIPVAHERITLFSSKHRNLNINSDELKSVLEGSVTNWRSLGYRDQKINIYRRSTKKTPMLEVHPRNTPTSGVDPIVDPYTKRLEFALKRSQIDPSYILSKNGFDSYEKQYLAAKNDPGAFVIGLRAVKTSSLSKIKIDGEAFSFDTNPSNYNLGYDVRLMVREDSISKKNKVFQQWFKKINLDYKRDITYLN